jgi:hypothetical protein
VLGGDEFGNLFVEKRSLDPRLQIAQAKNVADFEAVFCAEIAMITAILQLARRM